MHADTCGGNKLYRLTVGRWKGDDVFSGNHYFSTSDKHGKRSDHLPIYPAAFQYFIEGTPDMRNTP